MRNWEYVGVAVRKGERNNIGACAAKKGMSISEYVRYCINTFEGEQVVSAYNEPFTPTPLVLNRTTRPEAVAVALTVDEKRRLYDAANEKGLALSSYVRLKLWDVIGGEAV